MAFRRGKPGTSDEAAAARAAEAPSPSRDGGAGAGPDAAPASPFKDLPEETPAGVSNGAPDHASEGMPDGAPERGSGGGHERAHTSGSGAAGASDAPGLSSEADEPEPVFSVDTLLGELRHTSQGLPSGWRALDRLNVRFRPKELSLLAARTGHGKTSALVNLALNWLDLDLGGPLLFYSHEEPPEHILCRLAALLATKPMEPWTVAEIRDHLAGVAPASGREKRTDVDELEAALDRLRRAENRLIVVHKPGWSAERLAEHARKIAATRGVGAVFVDYLQRLPVDGTPGRRYHEVALTGRTLKALAVEIGAPVLAGAQINREVVPAGFHEKVRKAARGSLADALEEIKAARPDLHHLREGGSEQEVDLVLGLMNYAADLRTEAGGVSARTDHFEVGVLKNRYGEVGTWAPLAFSAATGRLGDRDAA